MKWMGWILLGLTCSCVASEGGYWSFGVTRAIYGDASYDPYGRSCSSASFHGGSEEALWVAGILLLPVLLDVVLLPVTVTHDLFWVE